MMDSSKEADVGLILLHPDEFGGVVAATTGFLQECDDSFYIA